MAVSLAHRLIVSSLVRRLMPSHVILTTFKSYVLKYFLHEKNRREIKNYNILRQLNEPTIKVVGSTDKSILFEDLENSKEYRLGIKEDLCYIDTARAIAKLYINFFI